MTEVRPRPATRRPDAGGSSSDGDDAGPSVVPEHTSDGTPQRRPANLGDYAYRGFVAETGDGLEWWQTCITSALVDLSRVEGFVEAFAGIAAALRHGGCPERIVGSDDVRAAFKVTLEWLDEDIDPREVAGWLRAGCWDPKVALRLAEAGITPALLLDDAGEPRHLVAAPDGDDVPLAQAVTEWELPIAQAVRIVARSCPGPMPARAS